MSKEIFRALIPVLTKIFEDNGEPQEDFDNLTPEDQEMVCKAWDPLTVFIEQYADQQNQQLREEVERLTKELEDAASKPFDNLVQAFKDVYGEDSI